MGPVRRARRVPLQRVDEGDGRGGRRDRRRRLGGYGGRRLRRPGCGDRGDQVHGRLGLDHDLVPEAHVERLLQPDRQLDAFEAADAEVLLQGIVRADAPVAAPAQLADELVDEVQHARLHGVG